MNSDPLPLPHYQQFLSGIVNDDFTTVKGLIENSDDTEKWRLLHGQFQFFHISSVEKFKSRNYQITRPFILAAVEGSIRVCEVMIENGVDVLLTECETRYNVFHCLVCAAFYSPQDEEQLSMIYVRLREILSEKQIVDLLKMENAEGLRPLEFAAQQGTLIMMTSFWNTPQFYVTKKVVVDVSVYQWYDVTEYVQTDTTTSRYRLSPLWFMQFLNQKKLDSISGRKLYIEGPIAELMHRLMKSRRHIFFPWLLLRFLYITLVMVYELDYRYIRNIGGVPSDVKNPVLPHGLTSNSSPGGAQFIYCSSSSLVVRAPDELFICVKFYIIVHSAVIIAYDICTLIVMGYDSKRYIILGSDLRGLKFLKLALGYVPYRFAQLFFAVLVIWEVSLMDTVTERGWTTEVIDRLRVAITALATWSILQLVQMIPNVGHVSVYIREMTIDYTSFTVFFGFIIITFGRLAMNFFSINSLQGCVEDFENIFIACYKIILTFLNMEDFRQFQVRIILYQHVHRPTVDCRPK